MVSRLPKIDKNGEVGDLSTVDPAVFKPFSELPEGLRVKLRGRPKAEETKERVAIRLSREVVAAFRASGRGWQTRINSVLLDWLREHRP